MLGASQTLRLSLLALMELEFMGATHHVTVMGTLIMIPTVCDPPRAVIESAARDLGPPQDMVDVAIAHLLVAVTVPCMVITDAMVVAAKMVAEVAAATVREAQMNGIVGKIVLVRNRHYPHQVPRILNMIIHFIPATSKVRRLPPT